jgi:hypothetical protein
VSEGNLIADVYSGTFPCIHFDTEVMTNFPDLALMDGNDHWVQFVMRTGHTSDELIDPANSAVTWFDNNGNIGHLKIRYAVDGTIHDVSNADFKTFIDMGTFQKVRGDLTDPAHPDLIIVEAY